MTNCVHHWLVASPNGPYSLAKCKKCGEYDAMSNSIEVGGWTGSPAAQAKRTPIHEDIEREVFLREKIKEDQEKAKKEFAIQEALKEARKAESRKRIPVQYSNAVKILVLLDLIKGKTIAETSRANKVPTSTIHGWRNTYSAYPRVKTSGDIEVFKRIIIEKAETESNLSSIARDYNIPRRTLRDWVKNQVA